MEIDKLILKIMWKNKHTGIARKGQEEGVALSDKIYYNDFIENSVVLVHEQANKRTDHEAQKETQAHMEIQYMIKVASQITQKNTVILIDGSRTAGQPFGMK